MGAQERVTLQNSQWNRSGVVATCGAENQDIYFIRHTKHRFDQFPYTDLHQNWHKHVSR